MWLSQLGKTIQPSDVVFNLTKFSNTLSEGIDRVAFVFLFVIINKKNKGRIIMSYIGSDGMPYYLSSDLSVGGGSRYLSPTEREALKEKEAKKNEKLNEKLILETYRKYLRGSENLKHVKLSTNSFLRLGVKTGMAILGIAVTALPLTSSTGTMSTVALAIPAIISSLYLGKKLKESYEKEMDEAQINEKLKQDAKNTEIEDIDSTKKLSEQNISLNTQNYEKEDKHNNLFKEIIKEIIEIGNCDIKGLKDIAKVANVLANYVSKNTENAEIKDEDLKEYIDKNMKDVSPQVIEIITKLTHYFNETTYYSTIKLIAETINNIAYNREDEMKNPKNYYWLGFQSPRDIENLKALSGNSRMIDLNINLIKDNIKNIRENSNGVKRTSNNDCKI